MASQLWFVFYRSFPSSSLLILRVKFANTFSSSSSLSSSTKSIQQHYREDVLFFSIFAISKFATIVLLSLSVYIYKRLIPRFRTSITRRDDPSISASLRYQLEWISCKLRYSRVVRRSWTIYTRQQSIFDTRSIDGKNVVKFYRRAIDFDWDC